MYDLLEITTDLPADWYLQPLRSELSANLALAHEPERGQSYFAYNASKVSP